MARLMGALDRELALTIERGLESSVGALLARGASPSTADEAGRRALHLAALRGRAKALELLLPGSNLAWRTKQGWTALHCAAHACSARCARLLAEAGADPQARDAEGRTPLLLALSASSSWMDGGAAIQELLAISDVLAVDAKGRGALASLRVGAPAPVRGWIMAALAEREARSLSLAVGEPGAPASAPRPRRI